MIDNPKVVLSFTQFVTSNMLDVRPQLTNFEAHHHATPVRSSHKRGFSMHGLIKTGGNPRITGLSVGSIGGISGGTSEIGGSLGEITKLLPLVGDTEHFRWLRGRAPRDENER